MRKENLVKNISNLFCTRHVEIVKGLIKWLRPETVLEIGCFRGFVSANILLALEELDNDGKLYIIDNFSLQGAHLAVVHNNLVSCGLGSNVFILPIDSKQAQPQLPPIDFAFIDGDHSLESVAHDFKMATELGAKCIVLHDSVSWWGVRDFVDAFSTENSGWNKIEANFDEGLTIFMAKEQKPPVTYTKEAYGKGEV